MIADRIENRSRYDGCHQNIKAALDFIAQRADDPALEDGTYPIIPDEVIVHVLSKTTRPREEGMMEIHKRFMDIHYMIKGSEACGLAPLGEDIDYNPDTDNGFWSCQDTGRVVIGEHEFYAVWPMEPHCPLCSVNGSEDVRKIICKVRVD